MDGVVGVMFGVDNSAVGCSGHCGLHCQTGMCGNLARREKVKACEITCPYKTYNATRKVQEVGLPMSHLATE